MDASEECGPINLFMHSVFRQVDVWFQGSLITSTNNHSPYKAIIQTLLNTNVVNAKSKLTTQLYVRDTEYAMDTADPNGINKGLYERTKFTSSSKTFDMAG